VLLVCHLMRRSHLSSPLFPYTTLFRSRTISFTPRLEQWKNRVSKLLSQNKKARTLMRQRGAQIEAVFGQLKENDRMRRLVMRGKRMVETEVGLKAIAHNLRKMHSILKTKSVLGLKNIMSSATCLELVA